jgi:hypothetical protein
MHRIGVHKPAIGVLVTVALTALYYRMGDDPGHDRFSAGLIALSFGIAAIIILWFTEHWSWRAVGVMIAMTGTAITYALVWGGANDLLAANPTLTRAILRASLDVGGVLLLVGLASWLAERRRGNRMSLFDWTDDDHAT